MKTDATLVTMSEDDVLDGISIAVAHEHYRNPGGGEHVAESLAEIFDAPIYTGIVRDGTLPDKDIEFHEVFSGIQKKLMDRSTFFRDLSYFLGWQYNSELTEYDVIIQSGNSPGWYVPHDSQVIIRYVHSTPRTPYDRFQDKGGSLSIRAYSTLARVFYLTTVPYPDVYVANSEVIQYRLRRYLDVRDAEVVYPPVPVESYEPRKKEDFYLTYSRMTPNKCFDEIIEAFHEHPDKRLVVGGDGPLRAELERRASDSDHIEFVGYMSEPEKRDLLGRAKALVYAARNEDFGMVPIEALASGTPVVGVDEGYTRFQIEDGRSGVLFRRGGLSSAIDRFEEDGVSATPEDLVEAAENYSAERFAKRMRRIVAETIQNVPTI